MDLNPPQLISKSYDDDTAPRFILFKYNAHSRSPLATPLYRCNPFVHAIAACHPSRDQLGLDGAFLARRRK
jgi:hypothetical protein